MDCRLLIKPVLCGGTTSLFDVEKQCPWTWASICKAKQSLTWGQLCLLGCQHVWTNAFITYSFVPMVWLCVLWCICILNFSCHPYNSKYWPNLSFGCLVWKSTLTSKRTLWMVCWFYQCFKLIDSCQFIIGGFIFGYNDKYFPTCSHATFYFT